MEVTYPASDLGMYLGCLYRSIFEHDELLRRMLVGLADRNIRRALEIFIEFCKSGHISGRHILNIRMAKGDYPLPLRVVMRVLLRLNRRFYDSDNAIIKNLFQANRESSSPSNFPRYTILRWLEAMWKLSGPTGVKGFHRVEKMLVDMAPLGLDARTVMDDLKYLVQAGCVATEHQKREVLSTEDLISLSASGRAHLRLISNTDYLAACSEDAWIADEPFVKMVAHRIGAKKAWKHYADISQARNAEGFASYLAAIDTASVSAKKVLFAGPIDPSTDATEIHKSAQKRLDGLLTKYGWKDATTKFPIGTVCDGTVRGIAGFGLFVQVKGGPTGMLHVSDLPDGTTLTQYKKGDKLKVTVKAVDETNEKMQLSG